MPCSFGLPWESHSKVGPFKTSGLQLPQQKCWHVWQKRTRRMPPRPRPKLRHRNLVTFLFRTFCFESWCCFALHKMFWVRHLRQSQRHRQQQLRRQLRRQQLHPHRRRELSATAVLRKKDWRCLLLSFVVTVSFGPFFWRAKHTETKS